MENFDCQNNIGPYHNQFSCSRHDYYIDCCPQCWMERDSHENSEIYKIMAEA